MDPQAACTKRRRAPTSGLGVVLFGAFVGITLAVPVPLSAQERVLTIFGKDACPANTICVVRPETERYRIPPELRGPPPSPEGQSWADRSRALADLGRSGTGSCSPSGGGGWTGCWAKGMRDAKAEREEIRKQERDPTNPNP